MAITVKIPTQLRGMAGGAESVQAEGTTVAEALESVFAVHGDLRASLYEENGKLRRFVNVYLGGEDIRFLDGLDTPIEDGAEVTILPAVAGGA